MCDLVSVCGTGKLFSFPTVVHIWGKFYRNTKVIILPSGYTFFFTIVFVVEVDNRPTSCGTFNSGEGSIENEKGLASFDLDMVIIEQTHLQ
jgi:hypothetical protein